MSFLLNVILTLTSMSFVQCSRLAYCKETVEILQLCQKYLNQSYNPGKTDFYTTNKVTEVHPIISMFQLVNMDEVEETLTINMVLSFEWNDARLSLKNPEGQSNKWYELKDEDLELIHMPLMRFNRLKSLKRLPNWGPKDADYFWFEATEQRMQFYQSMQIQLFCSFDFKSYPFDSHHCDMTFSSASNTATAVFYSTTTILNEEALHMEERQSNLPFDIDLHPMPPFNQTILGMTFPASGVRIHLARNDLGLLYGGFYGPTALFALISLTSYTINPDAVPGRLGVLVTLYLIASNVYGSIKAPPSRGFSYIEIWMIGVQVPILAAIIEYGVILSMMKYQLKHKNDVRKFKKDGKQMDVDMIAIKIDKWAFMASLSFMLVFALVYGCLAMKEIVKSANLE